MNHEDLILTARLMPGSVLVGESWRDYRQVATLELSEVVALSVDLDPFFADLGFAARAVADPYLCDDVKTRCEQFMRRYAITKANLDPGGTLPVSEPASGGNDCKVRLTDFARLADRMGWELPLDFPRGDVPEDGQGKLSDDIADAPLLALALAAKRKKWGSFDPANPNTAPKELDVVDWLMENGASSLRQAGLIAQLIRPRNAPTGARPRSVPKRS